MHPPIRTLPEKNNGNTFERTGGTAMRTVAFHFKVNQIKLIIVYLVLYPHNAHYFVKL
jgi:hypothetical protein